MILINTMCIMRGLMSVMAVVVLGSSVPLVPSSRCIHFKNGIIPDCLIILFKDEMRPTLKAELDSLVRRLTLLPRQRSANSGTEPGMPRLLWKDGVTSLTDLSAKLKVGIMFTLVVVSLQKEGSKFFTLVLDSSQRVNEMRQVFQMLLSYWVWFEIPIGSGGTRTLRNLHERPFV
jgi:hypothetical protein